MPSPLIFCTDLLQQIYTAFLLGFGKLAQSKVHTYILFLDKNMCCGYSLEAPHQGTSNEHHNKCFHSEIRKLSILFSWKKCLIWSYSRVNDTVYWERPQWGLASLYTLLSNTNPIKTNIKPKFLCYLTNKQPKSTCLALTGNSKIFWVAKEINGMYQTILRVKENWKRWHFIVLFLWEDKAWHFMWIMCYTDLHKEYQALFSQKIKNAFRMLPAAVVIDA